VPSIGTGLLGFACAAPGWALTRYGYKRIQTDAANWRTGALRPGLELKASSDGEMAESAFQRKALPVFDCRLASGGSIVAATQLLRLGPAWIVAILEPPSRPRDTSPAGSRLERSVALEQDHRSRASVISRLGLSGLQPVMAPAKF